MSEVFTQKQQQVLIAMKEALGMKFEGDAASGEDVSSSHAAAAAAAGAATTTAATATIKTNDIISINGIQFQLHLDQMSQHCGLQKKKLQPKV